MLKNLNPHFGIQAIVTFIVLGFCIFQLSKESQADKSNYFLLLGTVISYWFSPPSATKKETEGEQVTTTTTNVVTPNQIQTQTTTTTDGEPVDLDLTPDNFQYHSRAIAPPDERY